MKTIGEILEISADFLSSKGVPSARRAAEELLAVVLGKRRVELYMQFDCPVKESELQTYREYIKQKAHRTPWQYIVGEVDFFGCRIILSPDVLIPRPETELLVNYILKDVRRESLVVWDICGGSGCIGLALKKACPSWQVTIADISIEALAIVRKNAQINNLHVECLEGDLLAPFKGRKADLIVCNPPYIRESEFLSLEPEVRDFEPKQALIAGETGLEFYERLAADLPRYLECKAKVFFEIGSGMGKAVQNLFNSPYWKVVGIERDWSGHDRFFFLENE